MQTHYDDQHKKEFLELLEARARLSKAIKASEITTGKDSEKPLASWKASNGIHVTHMPDDEQGILRISCGGGDTLPLKLNYLVIRGRVGECIDLLEMAIAGLRECPE